MKMGAIYSKKWDLLLTYTKSLAITFCARLGNNFAILDCRLFAALKMMRNALAI